MAHEVTMAVPTRRSPKVNLKCDFKIELFPLTHPIVTSYNMQYYACSLSNVTENIWLMVPMVNMQWTAVYSLIFIDFYYVNVLWMNCQMTADDAYVSCYLTAAFICNLTRYIQDSHSGSLHVLWKHTAYLVHHRDVPRPIIFHQVQADIVMATARQDGCRNNAGATLPHSITKTCWWWDRNDVIVTSVN